MTSSPRMMQRLFTMFPEGAPGAALLLLRVALGLGFFDEGWASHRESDSHWELIASAGMTLLLFAGFPTPVICSVCATVEIGAWWHGVHPWQEMHLCMFLVALALAMLGPGAYSLDARMFGRRQVIFPPNEPDG